MKNFIERLNIPQKLDLLQDMRISSKENPNTMPTVFYGGKMHVVHGKTKSGEKIESVYGEFEIVKIYNSEPSKYDQRRFQNYMIKIFEKDGYRKKLEEYLKQKEEGNQL